jgi:hypothetical protein
MMRILNLGLKSPDVEGSKIFGKVLFLSYKDFLGGITASS